MGDEWETDYVSPMSDILMKNLPETVETIDDNEDDHREKYDGPSETDPTYRKSYSESGRTQPRQLGRSNVPHASKEDGTESEPRSSNVSTKYKDRMLDDPSEPLR
jgi:hypothetical protein